MKRDRIERSALRFNWKRASNRNGPSDLGANVRLNQRLMVRDVANLAGRGRIGVVVVPEANGGREKEYNKREAGCQAPATSVFQSAA